VGSLSCSLSNSSSVAPSPGVLDRHGIDQHAWLFLTEEHMVSSYFPASNLERRKVFHMEKVSKERFEEL